MAIAVRGFSHFRVASKTHANRLVRSGHRIGSIAAFGAASSCVWRDFREPSACRFSAVFGSGLHTTHHDARCRKPPPENDHA